MPSHQNDRPQVIALPPLILAATLALGFGLGAVWPLDLPAFSLSRPLGSVLIAGGIAIAILALRTMIRAGTSPDVRKPAQAVVSIGVFALSRNPIYLGMVLFSLGIALIAGSLWLFVLTFVFAAVMQYGVIAREEAYLERKFGADYLQYKARVRRWI